MMSTEERLQELLDQKDRRIEQLEDALSECSNKLDVAEQHLEHVTAHGWMLKRLLPAEQSLPVPRLELTIVRSGEEELNWYYRLIYRDFDGEALSMPLSTTRSRGHRRDPVDREGRIDLPLRDGVHIHHDMAHLDLPAFVVFGDRVEKLNGSRLRNDGADVIELGKRHRTGGL